MLKSVSWQQVVLCVAALAAILAGPKLMGADYSQVIQVVLVIFASFASGKPPSDPPPPPSGGAGLKLVACLAFFSFLGCHNMPARAPARAVVLAEASGIRVIARACSEAIDGLDSEGKEDAAMSLAEKCEAVVEKAHKAVLSAARAVDNWDNPKSEHDYLCAVKATYDALVEGAKVVEEAGLKQAEALSDALEVARPIASLAKDCQ